VKIDGNVGGGADGSQGGSYAAIREQVTAAQMCAMDGVWSTEVSRNPFLPLLLAAEQAPRLSIGTAIAVAFATNPMSLASTAHDLQSFSHGRFMLGLGSQIRPHIERRFSMPWSAPAERMTEFIQALRAIWASWEYETPLNFVGNHYRHTLMTPMFTPERHPWGPPPVLLAAVGARMTEVAARHADGLIVHSFTTPAYLEQETLGTIDRILAERSRTREEFIVSLPGLVATGDDDAELTRATEAVRRQLAFYGATPAYARVLEFHGWRGLHEKLHGLSRAGEWDAMTALVDDDVLNTFAVVGAPEAAGAEIARRFGGLVDRFTLSTPYPASVEIRTRVAASLADAVRGRVASGAR
jgi:probable F420-dependent oxidoreductase